jgi:carbamoyl-phosphate synthase large subunit
MVDYFKTAIHEIGGKVYATNSIPYAAAFVPADKSFLVPEINHPDYIKTLLEISIDYKIDAIIPLFDIELPVLARERDNFLEKGIHIIIFSPEVVKTCYNKWEPFKFLDRYGFKTPKTYITLESVLIAIEHREVDFPLILKPRWGMGSIGILEVETLDELSIFEKRTKRIIETSYLNHQSKVNPEHMVIYQEKLHGQEYGLDVVNNLRGEFVTTFVKRKIAMRSGETDIAITEDNANLMELGKELSDCLAHVANLDVDLFMVKNDYYILEMNPRFGGGYPFSHLAGANLPSAIIAWIQEKEADPSCFNLQPGIMGFKGIIPLKMTNTPINCSI